MAAFSRATFPANFYDITSAMLLAQPEPQYFYARLFMAAMSANLAPPSALGLPGREVAGVGADYSAAEKDRLELSAILPTEMFSVKADFLAAPGSMLRINRPVFANTTYTQASRRITGSISTTPITVASEQENLTLFVYGGPYDADNSRVAPYGIKSFDAKLGVHNAAKITGTHLKRDCHRFIDAVYVTLADLASTAVYPDGMTAVNDALVTGQFPLTYEAISRAEQEADTANLPTLPDGMRCLVLSPLQCKQLKDDPQYNRAMVFFPQYNILFPQYVATVGKLHIFKSTTLQITANTSSVNIHYGHLLAPGCFMGGMGRPPRVVASTDDDYAEQIKVIWLADLAFGLSDNRFAISVRSSA